jgi:glutamate formiminotransferase/formiminotetrahydrofolate cyclodeaminase
MMLIESVPNFSEGRNEKIIGHIADALRSVSGVRLIHIDSGYDANRTVYTLVGAPYEVVEALFRGIKVATEQINMQTQSGTHPRIGSCDVCPLIPLSDISIDELKPYALALSQRLGMDLQIPVFLYEFSALKPDRKNLAAIRKGEYENLATKMSSPDWYSDNGLPFNTKSGATVLGVRPLLIAYNVNLESKDVHIAKSIASKMRFVSGGPYIGLKAIGWMMEKYDCAQVSFNITDTSVVSIAQVFDRVKILAKEYDIEVNSSELIGLISEKSLTFAMDYYKLSHDENGESQLIKKLGLDFKNTFEWSERVIERLIK